MKNSNLKATHKKYGDPLFRMALTYLFDIGINNVKDADIEFICEKISNETPENSIMTSEFRADIVRCAAEVAKEPMWDILSFVQSDIAIDGTIVHPGKIIEFCQNCTGENIMTCVVPADTTDETIDELVKAVENKMEEHEKKYGDFSDFSVAETICETFKAAGVTPRNVPCDKTVYL